MEELRREIAAEASTHYVTVVVSTCSPHSICFVSSSDDSNSNACGDEVADDLADGGNDGRWC